MVYKAEVDFASVDPCGQLSRSRVGEYDWSCCPVQIFRQSAGAAKASVSLYIFGAAGAACLYEFLGGYAQALSRHKACEPCCGVGLSGVGVNACYEESLIIKKFIHFFSG